MLQSICLESLSSYGKYVRASQFSTMWSIQNWPHPKRTEQTVYKVPPGYLNESTNAWGKLEKIKVILIIYALAVVESCGMEVGDKVGRRNLIQAFKIVFWWIMVIVMILGGHESWANPAPQLTSAMSVAITIAVSYFIQTGKLTVILIKWMNV